MFFLTFDVLFLTFDVLIFDVLTLSLIYNLFWCNSNEDFFFTDTVAKVPMDYLSTHCIGIHLSIKWRIADCIGIG